MNDILLSVIPTLLMSGILIGLLLALIVLLLRKGTTIGRRMARSAIVGKSVTRLKLPKYDRPIRYICTRCGNWWEGDANRLIVAGITGYEPDDPNLQETISARQVEMTPIGRHMEKCHATIRTITPDNAEWEKLDPDKCEK